MARHRDGYSHAVSWLKVALPLVGLAALSTLFLFARGTRFEETELPEAVLAPGGGIETMSRPVYAGVTDGGTGVSVTAAAAWPEVDGSGRFGGTAVAARFDMPDGETAEIEAATGTLDPAADLLSLAGDVMVRTGSGWTMQSQTLDATLDWTEFRSASPVAAEGPLGTLRSNEMRVRRASRAGDAYLMEFDGDVHLVYRP